jgi:hypothetical protein
MRGVPEVARALCSSYCNASIYRTAGIKNFFRVGSHLFLFLQ